MDRFNNYVNIDLDAIYHNFQAISEKAGVTVMAVVKADAYGQGLCRSPDIWKVTVPSLGCPPFRKLWNCATQGSKSLF